LDDLLPVAEERGVRIVAAGVYNSGVLGASRPDPTATYDYHTAPAAIVERAGRLAAACEAHGVDLPTAAVQFPLRHPAVASVVVGARSAGQVRVNVDRMATPVPDHVWSQLESQGLVRTIDGVRS